MRQINEAINFYKCLIANFPDDAQAHASLGVCHLLLGDFPRGWLEYEWRLKTDQMAARPVGTPRWEGRTLGGKIILLLPEQGYGDVLQFVRYAPYVKARGGTVLLGCRPELTRLLTGCAGVDRVVSVLPPHDVHITLMSLPNVFQTSLNAIPAEVPYLRAPKAAGTQAVSIISRYPGRLRAGLVWASDSPHPNKHLRSMKLEQFSQLFNVPGVKFFSLQKGTPAMELDSIFTGTVIDLGRYLEDFADTAAAIQELDLVISMDTAVAHLAGALAKPVWTLIPFAPDWRWMLDREDSPWYPTMRLFRQSAPGDWMSVIERVAEELQTLAGDNLSEG
jgi:hypothetical protein